MAVFVVSNGAVSVGVGAFDRRFRVVPMIGSRASVTEKVAAFMNIPLFSRHRSPEHMRNLSAEKRH